MFFNEEAALAIPELESYVTPEYIGNVIAVSEAFLDDYEILDEGANIEITKKCFSFRKKYKEYITNAKKAIKKADKAEAKKNIKAARGELNKFKKEIQDMDSDVGSAVFGFFTSSIVSMARDAAFVFGALGTYTVSATTAATITLTGIKSALGAMTAAIGAVGASVSVVATYIYSIIQIILSVIKIADSFKNGDKTEDALNLYRVEMLKCVDKFDKQLNNLESKILK